MNRFNFFNNGRCDNEGFCGECNQEQSHCREKEDCNYA